MVTTTKMGSGSNVAQDPEVLGLVFIVGGALTVLGFILYRVAINIGTELESPEPIQAIQRALAPPREGR